MPIPELYHTCRKMLSELCPGERITRIRKFSWLMVGLYKSRSVHLSKVAEKVPGVAYLPSKTRRLRRLLNNPAIHVRAWYEPLATSIVQRLADKEIRLIRPIPKVNKLFQRNVKNSSFVIE